MRIAWLVAVLAPLTVACDKAPSKVDPILKAGAAAKVSSPNDPCAKAHLEGSFAWIADDYPSALACAKQKNLPIVIDLWAPWCHTCLSMQTTIFPDPSFRAQADQFVFVALDTDREVNAAAVEKFPPSAWPTFYVVDTDESVLARFVGGASVAQFHAFLDAGKRAKSGGAAGADMHLLRAERAMAKGDHPTVIGELETSLGMAPPDWPRRPDALVSLIRSKQKLKDREGCIALAEQSIAQIGNAASASDFLYHALSCADEIEAPKDPAALKAHEARIAALREAAVDHLDTISHDPKAPLSVDDRSDALMYLRGGLDSLGRNDEAKQTAEEQRALLDEAAAKAPNPTEASTYNWPRAEVYTYLKRPLDLVPALEKSVADLPNDYDPPARLGWIFWKGGKLDDAAKWTEKSLTLVYGPRRTRLLNQRAEIAKQAGDSATEKQYREAIVKHLESLPKSQTSDEAIAKAKQAVEALSKEIADKAEPKAAP